MLLVNFGVITADLVPPEWLRQKKKKKRVVLVQNWPQVCCRMVQLPPGEKTIKKEHLPARRFFGNVAHLAKRLPVPAQPARWLKTHRHSHSERWLEGLFRVICVFSSTTWLDIMLSKVSTTVNH